MKKVFFSLLVVAFVALFAGCKQSPEKMIAASWKVEAVEIQNLDEVVQKMIDAQLPAIDAQIKQLDEQIAAAKKAEEKQPLEMSKQQFEEQKAKLTPDAVKAQFKQEFDKMVGAAKMSFKEDKTYEFSLNEQVTKGTWSLSEDAKTLKTKDEGAQEEQSVTIDELTADKLVISREDKEGEMVMKFKMSFVKEGEAKKEEAKTEEKH